MRALVESVFAALNERDLERFEKITSEDLSFDFPGAGCVEGRRRALVLLKATLRKYPELQFSVGEIICEGERACAVWTNKGRSLEGNPYVNSGVTLMHFRDGRITFLSDYFKDTSFVS